MIIIVIITQKQNRKKKKEIIKSRKQKCLEKQLHRQFRRQTKEMAHGMTWIWLRRRNQKREIQ